MLIFNVKMSKRANKDIAKITNYVLTRNPLKVIENLKKDIQSLEYMPRRYKTLSYSKDKSGEYRRMISGNYCIIYKIVNQNVIISRIFHQKQNYLNQDRFILKEENSKYRTIKGVIEMRNIKNTYSKEKVNYIQEITGYEYFSKHMMNIIEEAEESIKNGRLMTLEEFRKELIRVFNVKI